MTWTTGNVSARTLRLPINWRTELRPAVLDRAGGRCEQVDHGDRCPAPATQVDHIVRGDDHSPANLQALCPHHHGGKSSREGQEARRASQRRHLRPEVKHPGLR